MILLSGQQQAAVLHQGHAVVTACPGSGKTRVLMHRVIRGLAELTTSKHRVVAMTFTNRATDEIQSRLDKLGIEHDQLWAGTIHAFALEWILRPYAPYIPRLRGGFSVADEFFSESVLRELKAEFGKPLHFDVNTARDRDGVTFNHDPDAVAIFERYQERLRSAKLVDYDDILHYAYQILGENREIAATIGSIIQLFCLDEVQDTQDLQFGILSRIFRFSSEPPTLFFVGDTDQCIYESLGAVSKTAVEIANEFGLEALRHLELSGNYRSTQRIIDYYRNFRPNCAKIQSLADHAADAGMVTFHNQTAAKNDLPGTIAGLIRQALRSGVSPCDICVVAPHWWHIRALGRALVQLLSDVDLDAPGLSPLHSQRENFWFKVIRLFLTRPSPQLFRTRTRWANEVVHEMINIYRLSISERLTTGRSLLRIVNSIECEAQDGVEYVEEAFEAFLEEFGVDLDCADALREVQRLFLKKMKSKLDELGDDAPRDIRSFRRMFRHPSGVVINTCHGIKGEEYDTVIAFGLLRGYVPNWEIIIHGDQATADDRASKLLYVICSRAKRRLHLIAESGRFTQNGSEYETTPLLGSIDFEYDAVT